MLTLTFAILPALREDLVDILWSKCLLNNDSPLVLYFVNVNFRPLLWHFSYLFIVRIA